MRRGRACSVPADFDYSGYSQEALEAARRLWLDEKWALPAHVQLSCDRGLAEHKIAAIDAEIARRKEFSK